jgi:hypothetical protein
MRQLNPTASDAFVDYGYVESVVLNVAAPLEKASDGEGNVIAAGKASETDTVDIVLMQTSKEEIDAVRALDGKVMEVIYDVPLRVAGTYQHLSLPLVIFEPSTSMNFAASTRRTLKINGILLAPRADFTRNPTSYNVTKNVPYVVLDDANATTDPADTAAALYTAIG